MRFLTKSFGEPLFSEQDGLQNVESLHFSSLHVFERDVQGFRNSLGKGLILPEIPLRHRLRKVTHDGDRWTTLDFPIVSFTGSR